MTTKSGVRWNAQEFATLFGLMEKQPWLRDRYPALEELLTLCDELEQQSLVLDLLYRFCYLSGRDLNVRLGEMEAQISNGWNLSPSDTLIAPLHNDQNADSSQMILQALKATCGESGRWHEGNFISSLPKAVNFIGEATNLILVDEFVGTGDQARRVLDYARNLLDRAGKRVKIHLATVAAMEVSRSALAEHVDDMWSSLWLKRGITDHFPPDELAGVCDLMLHLESKLLPAYGSQTMHSFGYKKSEAIYKLENSTTADNVFPLFHWRWLKDKSVRKTVLPPR